MDIIEHLNNLNKKLSCGIMTAYVLSSRSYFWRQLADDDAAHFPCLIDVCATQHATDMKPFKDQKWGCCKSLCNTFRVLVNWRKTSKFLLAIHRECFWSALQHLTWNNKLGLWLRFERQICRSWHERILSRLIICQVTQTGRSVVLICTHKPLWASFLRNKH